MDASLDSQLRKFTHWCNHYRARQTPAPVPTTVAATTSPAAANVYMTCEEKRRAGYVLDENEIDYCGPRTARGQSKKESLRDEIRRRLKEQEEQPTRAVRQQCRNGAALVPNCYDSIVDGQCWRQTLGNVGWDPTPIPIDQCPAEVRQSYCAEYSQYDSRTCPPVRVAAAAAPATAPQAAPQQFEECTEGRGVQTCYVAPRFGYSCTIEHRQDGATIWSGHQERCDSDFLLRRNAHMSRHPDPTATPPQPFTLGPTSETEAEIRRLTSDFQSSP